MKKIAKRILVSLLIVCMFVGIFPTTAIAASSDANSSTHTVYKHTEQVLAPGITASTNYAYATSDGKQIVYYTSTADLSNQNVEVHTTFSDGRIDNTGMAKMTDQVAALSKIYNDPNEEYYTPYFTPVAGVNADAFNMNTGKPSGAFVMESVVKSGPNNRAWFGIFADGTAVCGANNADWNAAIEAHGAPMEAVGGFQLIMDDGETVAHADSAYCGASRYPRSLVGVTADNKVVIVGVDGNQPPFSVGANYDECFAIMKEQGCVQAVCLDGGGSATFVQRPEGGNEVVCWNNPSDGSQRPVSSGLLFASTTPPSDVFERATLTAEQDYVTPYSTVNVTAMGISPAGTLANIPESAIWQLEDESFGTIENGVFTSNGTVGKAVIQLAVDGVVVGETSVNVVIPEITFDADSMTVPYNKTFKLNVSATTNGGINEVPLNESDVIFELSNPNMGTIDGWYYTTCDSNSGIVDGKITAKLVYDETKTATTSINFGKASVIAEDFEDGSADGWSVKSGYAKSGNHLTFGRFETFDLGIVNSETGKVKNGNYAMKLMADFSTGTAAGYRSIKYSFPAIDLTGASSFGMWMYLAPQDVSYLEFDIGGYEYYIVDDANIGDEGWYYISAPVSLVGSSVSTFTIYMTDPDASERYFNTFDDFCIYIDDLTIDYSNATDDREIPVFTNVTVSANVDSEVEMAGQKVNNNTIVVKAYATENTTGNYTGLNLDSARVYLDGVELSDGFTCDKGGVITISDIYLNDGVHTFRFEIDDKAGNTGFITKQIVINSEDADLTLVRRSSEALPLAGSVEYFDLVVKNIEKVDNVSLTIDLDTLTEWELQGADLAYGYEMTYSVEDRSHTATININKTADSDVTGEAILASFPVRVWATDSHLMQIYIDANAVTNNPNADDKLYVKTPWAQWQIDGTRVVRLEMLLESAVVEYVDGDSATFSGKQINVITENNRYRKEGYYNSDDVYVKGNEAFCKQEKNSAHVHLAGEPQSKAATCTTAGYTDRVFCAGCDCGAKEYIYNATEDKACTVHSDGCASVISWGAIVPATGHTYEVIDGVLKCNAENCDKLFNGVYSDGKTYIDGVVIADGWTENFEYFVDGVKLTGLQLIDGYYYVFDENGICDGKVKADGFCYNEDTDAYMYMIDGTPVKGDYAIALEPYFFDENGYAYSGEKDILGYTCTFDEKGKFIGATDSSVLEAGCVGTNLEYVLFDDGTLYIDGEGDMRDYTVSGSYGPWFYVNMANVKHVVIGSDVTRIGEYAFNRCEYIYDFTFEADSKIDSIGVYAFRACHRLDTIDIPASLTLIDDYAFFKCGGLTTVNFEENSNLKTIGREAFAESHYLEKIFIPASVSSIGDRLFVRGYADVVMQVVENSTAYFYAIEKSIDYELVDGIVPPLATGDCSNTVTWEFYPDGTLHVKGSGAIPNYASQNEQPWASLRPYIKKIVIGKDITAVGNYAFAYCEFAEAIEFEEGSKLTTIGVLSFRSAFKVTEVTLPDSVTYLASYAFGTCKNLETIYIPQGMEFMHAKAFIESANVTLDVAEGTYAEKYAVDNNIKHDVRDFVYTPIASGTCGENATWAFYENGELIIDGSGAIPNYASQKEQPWASIRHLVKKIVIGKDITAIGNYAFAYCEYTEEIVFEEGSKLTTIGVLSFRTARKVTEITLPETVNYLATYAFGTCPALEKVYTPQGMGFMHAKAFIESDKVTLDVAEGTYAEKYCIDNNIKHTTRDFEYIAIASGTCGENATWAFYENGELIIDGSGAIPNYASQKEQPWASVRHLVKKIVIGKDITAIGNYAFAYCEYTEEIVFEEGSKLTTIGVLSFRTARKVTEITLPETVNYLATYAFGTCPALEKVYIPQGMGFMHAKAFIESDKVTLDVAEGTYAEKYCIDNNIKHTTRDFEYIAIASGICGENATWSFYENGELIIDGSGMIPNYASHKEQPWASVRHLVKKIVIGKDITSIGNYAFAYCEGTEAIEFEEGSKLTTLGMFAFRTARKVTTVTLPETVTYIGSYALGTCPALKSVYVPEGVNYIHSKAFIESTEVVLNVADGSYSHLFAVDFNVDYVTR